MSCPYYWWNNHYACRKSGKDVNEDTYGKYCKNYSYSDCPIYKGNDTSGCFLTSACVEARGLPDDCYELRVLRNFRDSYLVKQDCGECEINHYYHVAPAIVERINREDDPMNVFNQIYEELVAPCIAMIENLDFNGAHNLYRNYVLKLEEQYLHM